MYDESITKRILYLREVEKLSIRQIALAVNINRKTVTRILTNKNLPVKQLKQDSIIMPYMNLISQWYKDYPRFQAYQIYQKLCSYGYKGSYSTVIRLTHKYRKLKSQIYHNLEFIPGQEAQIDWFFFNSETLGSVAGFLYLLSYSRYAWGMFYQRTSLEFLLEGHLGAFNHLKGLAHCHRYDNMKTVVIKRYPQIKYNPQFLDFSRHYKFSIYLCNPYKGNEKGRVERLIRDIRANFLYGNSFSDIKELNDKFRIWLNQRNDRIHRATGKSPRELLIQERLLCLPQIGYPARRDIEGCFISKTNMVEFNGNKYSVPCVYADKYARITAYPEKIEVWLNGDNKIATHKRYFGKKQTIINPLHKEKLLNKTPAFKMRRILQLIQNMNPEFQRFISAQDTDKTQAAYQLFRLLKTHSREMLISAVRELNQMNCFKIKSLISRLNLPQEKESDLVWPKDTNLLNIKYDNRRLNDYDQQIK